MDTATRSAPVNVLLVEDNPGDARLIRFMLAEFEHAPVHLVQADSLAAGLAHVRQSAPDVVLLDLGLPDSQGLDTLVRMLAAAPRLPIVVLSGHTDTSTALRAVRQGAQDYLLKGRVDADLLFRALRNAIEHQRMLEDQRYLAETSRALAQSLDYEATVECVVRLPVPRVADACILELRHEDGALPSQVVYPAEPDRARFPHAAEVPLTAHGRALGHLWLLRTAARAAFTAEDRAIAEELALRAALALDNAQTHRELQLAVRLRDGVLAATSHDLRSPLTGIKLQAALLRRRLEKDVGDADDDLHARVVRGLEEIEGAVTRSLGLLQELLDAAALQAGRELQLHRAPTDLTALAQRVLAGYQLRDTYHELRLEVSEPAVVGEWDAARLERVLDNLLSNAIKYTPRPECICIGVTREAAEAGESAVLRVRDHGVGIPRGELRRVFDRFYRASNVAADSRGVGIGLAGVRQIVEQHGGQVTVQSEEGVGSTFTVRLPLAAG